MKEKYNKTNIILLGVMILCTLLNLFAYFGLGHFSGWIHITVITCSILALIVSVLLFIFRKFGWFRLFFIGIILVTFFTWGYELLVFCGYQEIFESVDAMKQFIQSTGAWGMVVFMLIQFLQVVILPIPSMITTITGAILFGPTTAMILSLVAIIIGSYVAFFIGRVLGEKVVSWMIGKEMCEKYSKLLYEKGKYLFFLMMIFPIFPDDILCMIAGITTMSVRFFSVTIFISRPLAIIPTCYLGGGTIIPYYGWGLIVWGIIIVIVTILFILCYKYQAQIEKFVIRISEKLSKGKKCDSSENDKTPVVENKSDDAEEQSKINNKIYNEDEKN